MNRLQTYQATILKSMVHSRPRPCTPKFRVERDPLGWKLFDGAKEIGLVINRDWLAFDLWSFSPFEAPVMANAKPPGKVVDLHALRNTAINLPVIYAGELVEGIRDPFDRLKLRWIASSGDKLDLEIGGVFARGQRVNFHFRVTYDPRWARYRYFFDADIWKLSSKGLEPINLMMAGALASRPEKVRWTHSVWEDPNGKLKRLVHSNALFGATDFSSDGGGEWRCKNAPDHGGWIAYATNNAFNPAIVIHETSAPVYFSTCSLLFDEHICWQQAGLDQLDQGFFHFSMRAELVNLSPKLAGDFLRRAADPPQPKKWRFQKIALPFRLDKVNSFDEELDPWEPEDCPIFMIDPPFSKERIRWDKKVGHGDTHSIRLEGSKNCAWTRLFPWGAVCDVEAGARYRLSAWVKTKRVVRFARIEIASYEYTETNVIDSAHSEKLGGSRDWTLLQVELDSGDEAYVMPRFALYGKGTAWFDDVKLEKMRQV